MKKAIISRTFNYEKAISAKKENNEWIEENRRIFSQYRNSFSIVKAIYDLAYSFLEALLEECEICLPIDVWKLAEKCNLAVVMEDFSPTQRERSDRKYSPVAQLQMRRKFTGEYRDIVAGTIRVADYLGEQSVRFSIAHELAHFVLRKQTPIGLSYIYDACPGLYPLSDSDELLSDLFAYALLLPYPLFLKEQQAYEADDSRWPIDFSDWIIYLRDKTQMPEYHVVLAYQGIKQYTVASRCEAVRYNTPQWQNSLIRTLLAYNFSKSEINYILTPPNSVNTDESAMQRLSETIEMLLCTPDEVNEIIQIEEDDNQMCSEEWKKSILSNLYALGLSQPDIKEIEDEAFNRGCKKRMEESQGKKEE